MQRRDPQSVRAADASRGPHRVDQPRNAEERVRPQFERPYQGRARRVETAKTSGSKVWLKTGRRLFIILHNEIQGEARTEFNQRMYVYHYRIEDRYNCPVVSLGLVTGGVQRGAVGRYESALLGCRSVFEFPVVQLQDWRGREAELMANNNPFAS